MSLFFHITSAFSGTLQKAGLWAEPAFRAFVKCRLQGTVRLAMRSNVAKLGENINFTHAATNL